MERASNRSYSLRGDRMTRAQSLAMSQSWDQYSVEIKTQLDLNQIFSDKSQVILEIGSGMGEATAGIAQANPTRADVSTTGGFGVDGGQPQHCRCCDRGHVHIPFSSACKDY